MTFQVKKQKHLHQYWWYKPSIYLGLNQNQIPTPRDGASCHEWGWLLRSLSPVEWLSDASIWGDYFLDAWRRRAKRAPAAWRACFSNSQMSRARGTHHHYPPNGLNFDCDAVHGSALKAAPAALKSTEAAQWQPWRLRSSGACPWPSGHRDTVAYGSSVRNQGNVLNVMGPCHDLALLKQATCPFPRVRGLLFHDSEMWDLILWPVIVKQTDVPMHNNGQKITERNPSPRLSVCLSQRQR